MFIAYANLDLYTDFSFPLLTDVPKIGILVLMCSLDKTPSLQTYFLLVPWLLLDSSYLSL